MTAAENMLRTLARWVDEIPPLQDHKQRYGNKAFRTWHARLVQEAPALMTQVLPPTHQRAASELAGYLVVAFGNETRIDYGTRAASRADVAEGAAALSANLTHGPKGCEACGLTPQAMSWRLWLGCAACTSSAPLGPRTTRRSC